MLKLNINDKGLFMEKIDTGVQREIMIDEDILYIDNRDGSKNKITEAKDLLENSKDLVFEVDSAVQECQLGVSKAANGFDTQKRTFTNQVFKSSEGLLKKVGVDYGVNSRINEPFELSVDITSDNNIEIGYISSGRFTGMLLAMIFALVTSLTWIYFAMKALNLPFEKSNLNLEFIESNMDAVLTWIGGGIVGIDGDPMIGGLTLGFSALIVAWIIYALRVNFKADKNLRVAKKAYIESRAYSFSKDECKKEMLRVDAHLRDAIISIEDFTVILNEQNAILRRIVYVEGIATEDKDYHPSSKKVMRETERLMKNIELLLNTSITKKGVLNPESQKVLAIAKAVYVDFTARIYD